MRRDPSKGDSRAYAREIDANAPATDYGSAPPVLQKHQSQAELSEAGLNGQALDALKTMLSGERSSRTPGIVRSSTSQAIERRQFTGRDAEQIGDRGNDDNVRPARAPGARGRYGEVASL
jgi:hypothetical protein